MYNNLMRAPLTDSPGIQDLPDSPRYRFLGDACEETAWQQEISLFLEYWIDKEREFDGIPPRDAIDPTDFFRLLPIFWMADVSQNPFDICYRLVGTEIVDHIGVEPAGRTARDVFPKFSESLIEYELQAVAETGVISLYDGPPLLTSDPEIYRVQRVTAPLEGSPSQILIGIDRYHYARNPD